MCVCRDTRHISQPHVNTYTYSRTFASECHHILFIYRIAYSRRTLIDSESTAAHASMTSISTPLLYTNRTGVGVIRGCAGHGLVFHCSKSTYMFGDTNRTAIGKHVRLHIQRSQTSLQNTSTQRTS